MGVFSNIVNKISETHISKDERLNNFNDWYGKYGKGRASRSWAPSRKKSDYISVKSVWEQAGSPFISDEAHNEEFGKKFPDRPHAVLKPFYSGRTNFGSDRIYNIKNYDNLFAELAHTASVKDKGVLGRFIAEKRHSFEYDDPYADKSGKRLKAGDRGMYDKKMVDFPKWTEKIGLKDVWSLETDAHGFSPRYKEEVGVGREQALKNQYEDMFIKSVTR